MFMHSEGIACEAMMHEIIWGDALIGTQTVWQSGLKATDISFRVGPHLGHICDLRPHLP